MRCPYCRANDDKVVDSRLADDAAAIRRRRECLACGRRFTTYERVEEAPLLIGEARRARPSRSTRRSSARGSSGRRSGRLDRTTRRRSWSPRSRRSCGPSGGEVASDRVGMAVLERLRAARPGRRTCASRRSTRASRTSPTSSARSASSRRRTEPKRPLRADSGSRQGRRRPLIRAFGERSVLVSECARKAVDTRGITVV